MSQPFVGEIRMFAGNFAPVGWYRCDGSLLSIAENDTLFTLIGTTYGGDGQTTFAVPDLRGRSPMHAGSGLVLGETGGTEQVSLTIQQIPAHSHLPAAATGAGDRGSPSGAAAWAASSVALYAAPPGNTLMKGAALASAGSGQPHDNMMPFVVVTFIISAYGIFPQSA